MLSSLLPSLTAKIAAVSIAAAAAAGGLAAAGSLPAPAQQAVSQAAATVGIHVPSPHTPDVTGTDLGLAKAPTSTVTGTVTDTATPGPNHGGCISYAAKAAAGMGLTGSMKGKFIAALAQDSSAISAKVSASGVPDMACQTAITKAAKAATAPGNSGGTEVTGTVTGTVHNPTGNGSDSHPSATDHPGAANHPGKP